MENLDFWNNLLSGSLPPSLGNCTMLIELNAQNNSFIGGIPEEYGKLTRLRAAKLYYNSLSGIIPPSITNCTSLIFFEVAYNNFSGSIPPNIGQLTQAQWISFSYNPNLGGEIPDSIGNCTQLLHLTAADTSVSGTLPSSLFSLSNLLEINLQFCQFSGTLSADFSHMISLQKLFLGGNFFEGSVPETIGQLKSLQGVDLSGNRLTGTIPAQLSDSTSLTELDLSDNSLSGTIPSSLGELQQLNDLHLDNNMLVGNIPESLGNMQTLQNLTLGHNMLTGTIPLALANLHTLSIELDLSFNNLTGSIPSELGGMAMVQVINLAGNHFTGEIPGSLGDCHGLLVLNLSRNSLEGHIPDTFAALQSLQYLDVSDNDLSGNLPLSLGNLLDLVFLNVSFNELEGPIPEIGVYGNSSPAAFLGNPGLCGKPLPISCGSSTHYHSQRVVIIASASAAGAACLLAIIFVCVWWYCRKEPESMVAEAESEDESFGLEKAQFRSWKARELRAMTNDFDIANVIGRGSVSVCYKGLLDEPKGKKFIAIKKLNLRHGKGSEARRSFVSELKTLCNMRHRHLVKVLGYCVDSGEVALVLEFMEKGNLDEHLHDNGKLSWEQRLSIAVDVAEGLVYLHHEYVQPVIHCDLKPKNILLRSDMVAKIADFGIARLLDRNHEGDLTISSFRGTLGYAAPECAAGSRISTKADVYSYGVLLMELVTGVRPTSELLRADPAGTSLPIWAGEAQEEGRTNQVLDKSLQTEFGSMSEELSKAMMKEADEILWVASRCCKEATNERPNMKAVRDMVKRVKEERGRAGGRPYPELLELVHSQSEEVTIPSVGWLLDPSIELE